MARQAVVVIHGIGDQAPMQTLPDFVDSILGAECREGGNPTYYSKPDRMSATYELRKYVSKDSRNRTDFFEFYWAHLMPKATWGQLLSWGWRLAKRRHAEVPWRFRGLWWGVRLLPLIVVASVIMHLLSGITIGEVEPPSAQWGIATTGLNVLWLSIQGAFLKVVGDAAIYLRPSPANVAGRQAVREAGVTLLKRLHDSGSYDRIIVVGHSLGSVVGYDILSYAWQLYRDQHKRAPTLSHCALRRAEALTTAHADGRRDQFTWPDDWHAANRALWAEQRENSIRWLVSDFVTAGSPLAHARFLLAESDAAFDDMVQRWELSTSPPTRFPNGQIAQEVTYPVGNAPNQQRRSIKLLHHGAWTAVVRWTNLYFESQALLHGDPIGGQIAPVLGCGIRDVRVRTQRWKGLLAHTHYWPSHSRDGGQPECPTPALRDAVDIARISFFTRNDEPTAGQALPSAQQIKRAV